MGEGLHIMSKERPEELIKDSHQDVTVLIGKHLDQCWCQVCHIWDAPRLLLSGLICVHCGNRI